MRTSQTAPRVIDVRLRLVDGHEYRLALPEDAPELRQLFTALVHCGSGNKTGGPALVQLPLKGGRSACSVAPEHIVSVVTTPPVLVQLEEPRRGPARTPAMSEPIAEPPKLLRTPYAVIDDFLSVDENLDLRALAMRERARLEPGTVAGRKSDHRRNSVIMDFDNCAHAQLLANRLLVWFPLIAKALSVPIFPLAYVESQLTASNDGDYYRAHLDVSPEDPHPRTITCIYYLFREPKGFTGGALRLYDTLEARGDVRAAESFEEIAPVNNRLVAFPSRSQHEFLPVRCPSRDFADSRFAITIWLHRSDQADPNATFGWGHFRCGVVVAALTSETRGT